ncbi:MAG TPA: CBS domain-containing protein [Terriglobia bacterium]|nr:CBS domain-containing protein [Terriglobia bacterium]
MKVREIMTTNVECVAPDTGVLELAGKMKTLDIGFIPICENDRLAGTVTDRDIVIRGIAGGKNISTSKANDIMTKDIFWCFDDEDVKDVARRMSEKEVRRMLILNREKRLVGVVSIGDISRVEEKESGKALKNITDAA